MCRAPHTVNRSMKVTDWRDEYKKKLVPAEQAVRAVKPGDRVYFGFPPQPTLLSAALSARRHELDGVEMLLENPRVDDGWLEGEGRQAFNVVMEFYIGPVMRRWTDQKRADFLPLVFSLEHKLHRERPAEDRPLDVVMIPVSTPDEHGFCSFGANLWNKRACALKARTVLAEVDATQIRTYGQNYIHVSEVDYFVEHTPHQITEVEFEQSIIAFEPAQQALLRQIFGELTPQTRSEHIPYLLRGDQETVSFYASLLGIAEPDDVFKAIAHNVEPLIKDGDTIQIGVAGPTAYLPRLGVFDNRVDLGCHSELGARGLGKLIEAGVVNGKRKTLHPGRAVFTSLEGFGSADLAIANGNPLIELYDADYVVNIRTIAAHDNMVSLNSALSIDLTGQITCETTLGGRIWNGTGGQPEFHMGAMLSRGGRALTLMPSTALGGSVSRIVPQFDEGAVVTIPRYFADYVVTEYGVARLLGRSVRERADQLIGIAHPDFRAELLQSAKRLFWSS